MMIIVKMTLKGCVCLLTEGKLKVYVKSLKEVMVPVALMIKTSKYNKLRERKKQKRNHTVGGTELPSPVDSTFMGTQFSLPPQTFDEITPFQFF